MARRNFCKGIVLTAIFIAAFSMSSYAAMDLETEAPVSGISVVLNNYFARVMEPEKALAESVKMVRSAIVINSDDTVKKSAAVEKLVEEATVTEEAIPESAYKDIAISKIESPVNIRTQPTTQSESVGKIANHSAATILETVEGEDGTWYKIESGNVTGYIKAMYFVTGDEAEALAREVSRIYGKVVGTATLKLRKEPSLEATTLTLLAQDEIYEVLGQEGNFLKIQVDDDLVGYVFKDYMDTNVSYNKAESEEEERIRKAEEEKRKKEAEEALRKLEEERKQSETKAEIKETESSTAYVESAPTLADTHPYNPEEDEDESEDEEYETEEEETEETTAETTEGKKSEFVPAGPGSGGPGTGPGSGPGTSTERSAIVAYAKQFLGGTYVYGGTDLNSGVDCSGFTMRIYEKFGHNIGRTSRDQAANGTSISAENAQPGDLFFYDSGGYINHVAMYIGGGQVIHASSSTTGIIISNAYYRTPCKVCTFLK